MIGHVRTAFEDVHKHTNRLKGHVCVVKWPAEQTQRLQHDEWWRNGWTARRGLWKRRDTTEVSLAISLSLLLIHPWRKTFPVPKTENENIWRAHSQTLPLSKAFQHTVRSSPLYAVFTETKPHTISGSHHERRHKQGAPLWWSLPVYIHCLLIKCSLHCRHQCIERHFMPFT